MPESEWEGDQILLAHQPSGKRRSPSPYALGEEQMVGSPAPYLGSKEKFHAHCQPPPPGAREIGGMVQGGAEETPKREGLNGG